MAVAKAGKGKGKGPTRRKLGKKALAAAAEISQLLNGYVPPLSSAALDGFMYNNRGIILTYPTITCIGDNCGP